MLPTLLGTRELKRKNDGTEPRLYMKSWALSRYPSITLDFVEDGDAGTERVEPLR